MPNKYFGGGYIKLGHNHDNFFSSLDENEKGKNQAVASILTDGGLSHSFNFSR